MADNEETVLGTTPNAPVSEPDATPDMPPQENEEEARPDGEDEAPAELEMIEVEIGGKTYTVPKDVEEHLLREEDYTQKTQTLAEQRREVEAYQQSLQEKAQLQEAVLEDIAQVKGFDAQLGEYAKIDWPAYQLQDPGAAQYHWMQYQQLQGFRNRAAASLNEKMQHVSTQQETVRAATIEKTVTALSKPDPAIGWPGYSPTHMSKLSDFARSQGITDAQMSRITSPESIKILNLAFLGSQSLKKAVSGNAPAKVDAQPVRQVPSNRSPSTASASGDNLSTEKWVERERRRLAQRTANGSGLRT